MGIGMQKVANYRRAIWLVPNQSVEHLMRRALNNAPSVSDTKFEYSDTIIAQISNRSINTSNIALYFTLFSEGEPAGIVENGGAQIGRTRAPAGNEFLKTGIYMVLEENHMAFIADGHTNDGQISNLIAKFLIACGLRKSDVRFTFMARPNRREITRLLRSGVKSIDLGISSFMTTAEDMARTAPTSPFMSSLGAMVSTMRGVFGRDRSPAEAEAAAEIQAKLHLGYDGRGASPLVPMMLTEIAETVIEGDDEFKILTNEGISITRDKIIVRREVNVSGDQISIDPISAFSELRNCMRSWRREGVLEE